MLYTYVHLPSQLRSILVVFLSHTKFVDKSMLQFWGNNKYRIQSHQCQQNRPPRHPLNVTTVLVEVQYCLGHLTSGTIKHSHLFHLHTHRHGSGSGMSKQDLSQPSCNHKTKALLHSNAKRNRNSRTMGLERNLSFSEQHVIFINNKLFGTTI